MDIIYFANLFSIIMIIINFAYISVNVFDFTIRIPFISENTIYVPQGFRNALDNIQNKLINYGNPIVFFFIIFYLIFYFIYIAIKTLVPDTGFQTLFIPLKELLLKIPPLPTLEKYGIFRLIECIFNSFGISPALKGFIKFNLCFIDFSRDNIRTILKMIFQDIDFNIENEKSLNNNKEEKKENIIHKQIEEEVNICYKNIRKPMKIGMNEVERARIEFDNNQAYIKCKANSIGKYIRII
jgi:hypothetical protein